MKKSTPVLILHGGAGRAGKPGRDARIEKALKKALSRGYELLDGGLSAMDAACVAIEALEDSPLFNAGFGSYPNLEGVVETDAAIMDSLLNCGAVAAVKGVSHPIRLARLVMERTDHVLIAGPPAERLARLWKLPCRNLLSPAKRRAYEKAVAGLAAGKKVSSHFLKLDGFLGHFGTVGAVALDKGGRICAATSTGGIFLKLPGRVGDTPLIGCGTYADDSGGCSATGYGEGIIRLALAKEVVTNLRTRSAREALELALRLARRHGVSCGAIAVDRKADVAFGKTAESMSYVYFSKGKAHSFLE